MTSSIAAIHVAKKQLGFDDDTYRAKLQVITGRRSAKDMTEAQRQKVLTVFRNEGFQPAAKPAGRTSSETLSGKYAPLIRALWLSGYNMGVIKDPDDRAILKFIKGQTENNLDHAQFVVDPKDQKSVVEGIKKWILRKTGNRYPLFGKPVSKVQPYLNDAGVQVVLAQWQMLAEAGAKPAETMDDWWAGASHAIVNADRKTLVDIQIALGKLVRKAKGAK